MRSLPLVLLLALLATACTDTPDAADPDAPRDTLDAVSRPDDRLAIYTRDGSVKLALTDETVYFWPSEETMERVEEEVERGTEGLGSFAESLGDYVQTEVIRAVRDQLTFQLEEIRDIRYEDGRLNFDFADPRYELPDMRQNDQAVTERFRPDDARRFADAFQRAKQAR